MSQVKKIRHIMKKKMEKWQNKNTYFLTLDYLLFVLSSTEKDAVKLYDLKKKIEKGIMRTKIYYAHVK